MPIFEPPILYLLDTNTVSHIVRPRKGGDAARNRLQGLGRNEFAAISVITEAEILYGLAKKPDATSLKTSMNAFLATINVLPWSRAEAEAYADLRAHLESQGTPLGNLDTLIAAHAVSAQAILVTHDGALSSAQQKYLSSYFVQDWTV